MPGTAPTLFVRSFTLSGNKLARCLNFVAPYGKAKGFGLVRLNEVQGSLNALVCRHDRDEACNEVSNS